VTCKRGGIYLADIDQPERKRVLVVSSAAINGGLRQPVVALITSRDRPRSVPTYVEVTPDEAPGALTETSFILCHFLLTVRASKLDREPLAMLDAFKMVEVHDALKRALDLV
jgi:mRNA-degrading endonuclease toxin of MazEF toxin-antitoxin module